MELMVLMMEVLVLEAVAVIVLMVVAVADIMEEMVNGMLLDLEEPLTILVPTKIIHQAYKQVMV